MENKNKCKECGEIIWFGNEIINLKDKQFKEKVEKFEREFLEVTTCIGCSKEYNKAFETARGNFIELKQKIFGFEPEEGE